MSEPLSKADGQGKKEIKRTTCPRVHGGVHALPLRRSVDHRAAPGGSLLLHPSRQHIASSGVRKVQIYHDKHPQLSCSTRFGTAPFHERTVTPTTSAVIFTVMQLRHPRRPRRESARWYGHLPFPAFFAPHLHSCTTLLQRVASSIRRYATTFSDLTFWKLSFTFHLRHHFGSLLARSFFLANPLTAFLFTSNADHVSCRRTTRGLACYQCDQCSGPLSPISPSGHAPHSRSAKLSTGTSPQRKTQTSGQNAQWGVTVCLRLERHWHTPQIRGRFSIRYVSILMHGQLLSPVEHSADTSAGTTRDYAFAVPPASYDRCNFPGTMIRLSWDHWED